MDVSQCDVTGDGPRRLRRPTAAEFSWSFCGKTNPGRLLPASQQLARHARHAILLFGASATDPLLFAAIAALPRGSPLTSLLDPSTPSRAPRLIPKPVPFCESLRFPPGI